MRTYPKDVAWFRSLHYGVNHVCLWWMIYPDGRLHIAGELVKAKVLISVLSQEIKAKTKDLGIKSVRYTAALKEQMSGKNKDGETRLDTFRANGISLREYELDPVQAWTRVAELFGVKRDGKPWLTIDPSCEHLRRAITNAVSDPTDPELVLESPNDQPLSALCIGAMSRPSPRPFSMPPLPPNAVGHLLEDCRRAGLSSRTLAWR